MAYTKLASAFDTEATASSSLRRSQRLIAECVIDTDLIAKLILKLIPVKGPYNLAMDRINWKYSDTNINILTLAHWSSNTLPQLLIRNHLGYSRSLLYQ